MYDGAGPGDCLVLQRNPMKAVDMMQRAAMKPSALWFLVPRWLAPSRPIVPFDGQVYLAEAHARLHWVYLAESKKHKGSDGVTYEQLALHHAVQADRLGYKDVAFGLADMYRRGIGCSQDLSLAEYYARQSRLTDREKRVLDGTVLLLVRFGNPIVDVDAAMKAAVGDYVVEWTVAEDALREFKKKIGNMAHRAIVALILILGWGTRKL